MDLQTVGTAGGAALGGGALVLWWAKLLMQRLVKQYDEAHEKHEQRFDRLADKVSTALTDIRTKMAAIEVRAAEVVSIREDVKKLPVIEADIRKLRQDMNIAHERIRQVSRG